MSEEIQVLHVDDEPDFADMAATFLEREDDHLVVDTATKVNDALDRIADTEYDCIVSDHDMPKMSGIEFLETVRQDDPDIPFILFTGRGSEEVASNAISAGVSDYLQKDGSTDQYTILANRIRNHTERVTATSERHRHLQAIETAHEGISILDEDARFIYVNDAFASLYGYEPDEMVDERIELIHRDEDVQTFYDEILPVVKERGHWRGETIGSRADGSTFQEDHALSMTDTGELICTVRDVSERKKHEQRFRESEKRYRQLVQGSPNPVYVEQDDEIVYANDALVELLNADTQSDVLGINPREYVHPDFEELAHERFQALKQGESIERLEGKIVTRDDETKHVEVTGTSITWDGEPARQIHHIDITERKENERELDRVKDRYQTYVENASDIISVVSENGEFQYNSPSIERVLGYSTDELLGENAFELMHPEDREEAVQRFAEMIDSPGATTEHVEFRFPDADGSWVWLESVGSNQRSTEADGYVINSRDITERKEQERELREYKLQFEAVLNNPETLVGILSPEGIVERMNETALETIGVEAKTVEGEPFWETPWWSHSSELQSELRSWIDRAANGEFVRFDATHPLPDGSEIHVDATLYPVIDENDNVTCLVGVGRDVTSLKEREQELERKNEQLDEFAGMVSHDLRNPLNVATGRLELAREECNSDHLDALETALDRMETLIDDVLSLARANEQITEVERIELAEITEKCWRNVATGEATLVAESECVIGANRTRVAQLLENLFRNAVEHGGNDITIMIGDLEEEAGFYVADDGSGIPEDERSDVFESGYSTSQEGTGLGLSIVKRVAEAHDWDITLTDSETGGTRFEIRGVEVLD
jgi:PAS domain S-box-containing protein